MMTSNTSPIVPANDQFRAALRRLAKAVVILTCQRGATRYAMAATAVSELSMDPPSMLVCVNKTASIHEPLTEVDHFTINILHHSHRAISENCSGAIKGEARFGLGAWTTNGDDLHYLRDAQASIFCRKDQVIDYATHSVFFGIVESALTAGEPSPLIYMDGRYVRVPEPAGCDC
jgi:flavin reductase (DIM6/NTAB) family NADH-FMN oxidoreductase RutF